MSFFYGGGFGVIFPFMFVLVCGMILVTFVRGIMQWNRNNHSPRLTVDATVVAKRGQVNHHHHHTGNAMHTTYYATFQVESGDRMELSVSGTEYGMLAEGDVGKLTFQGTRYIEFVRR